MQRFENKVVFVGGASASSGIGQAMVKRFAAEGAKVIFAARGAEGVASLEAELRAGGATARGIAIDLADMDAYAAALRGAAEEHGRLDIFVHNAAHTVAQPLMDSDEALWERHFQLNTKACFVSNRTAAELMRPQGGGAIVNIATIAAVRAVPRYGAYGATKAAMIQMSQSLAVECARDNVRVNVVAPGMIRTDSLMRAFENNKGAAEEIQDRIPMGRFGKPDELASAVLFFASDDASYVTGQLLLVDGGKQHQMIV